MESRRVFFVAHLDVEGLWKMWPICMEVKKGAFRVKFQPANPTNGLGHPKVWLNSSFENHRNYKRPNLNLMFFFWNLK